MGAGLIPLGKARLFGWIAVAAFVLGTCPSTIFANSQDRHAGTLLLKSGQAAEPIEALRQTTQIHARITGNLARVHVVQSFVNTSDEWMEGLYTFPLPPESAVDELEMVIGERRVKGEIQRYPFNALTPGGPLRLVITADLRRI